MRALSRLTVTAALTALFCATLGASDAVALASSSPDRSMSAGSPVLGLPVGPAPTGVPYGIGKTLYLNGIGYDLAPSWSSMLGRKNENDDGVEFQDVDITRGVTVWAIRKESIDPLSWIGWFRPGVAPAAVTSSDSYPGLATTSGGFVAAGVENILGASVPITTYSTGKPFGPAFVWDPQGQSARAKNQSVGGRFVVQGHAAGAKVDRSAMLYPGHTQVALPDNTYGVGKGTGWVATAESYGSACYRTAAISTPTTLRARVCSQTLPMLSDDGTNAVAVLGNQVSVYDARTGALVNATDAPTLSTADSSHYYHLVGWQGPHSYLVNVRDGSTLAILRCDALTGACVRAVTASVLPGVTAIVS